MNWNGLEIPDKPYYSNERVVIYHADCRDIMPLLSAVDLVVTDPLYGVTSFKWDKRVDGWAEVLPVKREATLWCFGSFRAFMGLSFPGWRLAQDIIWEKHNGSNFHADRFKRVHELIVQFYQEGTPWSSVYKNPIFTMDATKRTLRRKKRPPHMGYIDEGSYQSEDGGPRLQRSVIYMRSCHGHAEHPMQKPVELVKTLLKYSCPPGGVVLDCFMGSGSTLVAANNLGLKSIGIDIKEKDCEIAAKRCS